LQRDLVSPDAAARAGAAEEEIHDDELVATDRGAAAGALLTEFAVIAGVGELFGK
jgi:hypothetical protein